MRIKDKIRCLQMATTEIITDISICKTKDERLQIERSTNKVQLDEFTKELGRVRKELENLQENVK